MKIELSPFFAKLILRLNPFNRILVMCRGYSEDCENLTELVWTDDKYLQFYDEKSYPEFQLWILIRNKLITQGFEALTGKDGKWIQARTKGAGHGSVSRAFYARTSLVKKIFETAS